MKKRAMKKWIPRGCYCDSCKWWHHIKTIKLNRSNCEYTECKEVCWTKPNNSCGVQVVKCDYMNYIDKNEDTYLFDQVKECGEHDSDKWR